MAEREMKRRQPSARDAEVVEDATGSAAPGSAAPGSATPAAATKGEKLKAELDELLDEIDEVLEDNAEEFVRNYVQKGGQ